MIISSVFLDMKLKDTALSHPAGSQGAVCDAKPDFNFGLHFILPSLAGYIYMSANQSTLINTWYLSRHFYFFEGTFKIINDIVDVLDSHGYTNQVIFNAAGCLLFFG